MKKLFLILAAICIGSMAMAQWSSDPKVNLQLIRKGHTYDENHAVNPKTGDYYFFYNEPGGKNYLQIVDKNGSIKHGEKGLLISEFRTRSWTQVNKHLLVDAEGNAIIVVTDCRNAEGNAQDISYTAYKISPSGEFLWGTDGIDLGNGAAYRNEASMKIIELTDGSYVFAWQRSIDSEGKHYFIVMQRADKNGVLLWGAGKKIEDATIPHTYPWLVASTNNQFIMMHAQGSNQDLIAQKYEFDGEAIWPEATTIYKGGFGGIPIWTFVSVCSDNKGGMLVSWNDDRLTTNFEKVHVAHINPDGSHAFTAGAGGQRVGYAENSRMFAGEAIYDTDNSCTYITWKETTAAQSWQRVMMQKLDKSGELMYDPEGLEIIPWSKRSVTGPFTQNGEKGQFSSFFMLRDSINIGYGETKIFGALLNGADGKFVWNSKFVAINDANTEKGALAVTPMIGGQWICKFGEEREKIDDKWIQTTYIQNVNLDGKIGGSVAVNPTLKTGEKGFYVYPNPIQEQANFLIQNNQKTNVSLKIYNSVGQMVATVFEGSMEKGNSELSWTPNNLPQGMYMAVLTQGSSTKNLKIIVK